MNWRPTPEQREAEDDETRRSDRRLVRLAARVGAHWFGYNDYDLWLIFTRIKALQNAGVSAEEVMRRLNPP